LDDDDDDVEEEADDDDDDSNDNGNGDGDNWDEDNDDERVVDDIVRPDKPRKSMEGERYILPDNEVEEEVDAADVDGDDNCVVLELLLP
jgi:hypothetical protein